MGVVKYLLLFLVGVSFLYIVNACTMEDVEDWRVTQDLAIIDVQRGTFWNKTTTDITSMTSISVGGAVNYADYLNVLWDANSGRFTISTSEGYEQYEEKETSQTISFTVFFLCTGGTNSLIFDITVQDTNNNPPTFMPTDQYEFTVTPPLPPGFQITGCGGDNIVVRDIDLTTSSIDFTIEDNPYFEIAYAGRSSTDPKEFLASLKTKDLIRGLSQDIELTIYATDVDGTQDPRITRNATIRVKADEAFLFPEEPVFAQPFYIATYEDNLVVLERVISLSQGFDDEVNFSLDGEFSEHFRLVTNGNELSIEVVDVLSNEVLGSGRIVLVVKAEREYTSGATATIIIQLPEVLSLAFEQTQYQGRIVDNVLETLQVILAQGYQDGFNISIQNEFASSFSTSVEANVITLQMTPLEANVLDGNNFISLLVVATNEYSSTTAVVTLDIIKDDNISPAFENALYTGEYATETGLAIGQIILGQGYDQTVNFTLSGEHEQYFSISNAGAVITLSSSGIPTEIWAEQQLLLTVAASKPRAVTASTAVAIRLPSARDMAFALPTYSGTLQNTNLTLEVIVLSEGYAEDVNFTLSGGYATYFTLSPAQNEVAVTLSAELPDDVITENSFLALTLSASGTHAITASTTVLLEIIKQDANTPVFSHNVYAGAYLGPNLIEIENMSLSQGYDSSVTFRLEGEYTQYFQLTNVANNLNLALVSDIPPDVIFREQVLLFSILAEKPLTVGANAAVSIAFSRDLTETALMRFAQKTYIGSLEDDNLVLDAIVLVTGYDNGTEFSLIGDYESYFSIQNSENVINVTMQNPLPKEILENNEFIILEIEAIRERAVSIPASIVISITKEEIDPPVFSNAYYRSVYANGNLENLTILLSKGYDETVTFELQGDNSMWFTTTNIGNNVQLTLNTSMGNIPNEALENNDYFLFSIIANKPNAISARAAIFIHLPKETPETVLVQFLQASYVGRIENGTLYAPAISLNGEREPISFKITGEYSQFFEVTQITPTNVEVRLTDGSLPVNLDELAFIIIDIEAQYPEAISGHTAVILEVVKESEIVTPVFEQAYYTGVYSKQEGLRFEQSIRLSQGFDETVVFALAGDDAQWFELSNRAENNFTLIVSNNELSQLTDRSHLIFSVVASKNDTNAGNTAVIINLSDFTTTTTLRFAQNSYMGSIQNNTLALESITLEEGYSSDLNISFTGEHAEYFELTNQEDVFTLQLLPQLPANIIDDTKVLVFTIEVKNANSRTHTTIVLEIIKTELIRPSFKEAYYVGSYSLIGGFTFDHQIILSEGYDETVLFSLEGDDSQWFGITENQHPILLTHTNPIPNEIISNRKQLVFVILAEKSENMTARSTIIISIVDESESILRFDRTTYMGTIDNNTINLDSIILSEGYNQNVSFVLKGDLERYFSVSNAEATVTISLNNSIPEAQLPSNGIIILELQASAPNAVSALSTIVFTIIQENTVVEHLIFSNNYYTGHYTETEGLVFNNLIQLSKVYNETVQFILEGESSQYFEVVVESENSVTLSLVTPIPSAVVINNHHLLFTIGAEKSGFVTGRATIVIALLDEYKQDLEVLGFDRITYMGSLEIDSLNLGDINVTSGYSNAVSFRLFGDLESYFETESNGSVVTIKLTNPIPAQSIPDNGIIVLELEAFATGFMSAHAAIVITVVQKEPITSLEKLIFSEVYYTGHYTVATGLTFTDEIILSEGFDTNVTFALEGDSSQYFEAVVTSNLVSLKLISPIPSSVVMNNHQLIFTIRAEKPDAITARATVVISLLDELSQTIPILGFSQVSYIGSIEGAVANIDPIIVSKGYSSDVNITLHGELQSYFTLLRNATNINVSLISPIPEEMVPSNRIIVLEMEASAPDTISAHATIVFEVVQDDVGELTFNEPFYTGQFNETDGLTFNTVIYLSQGYDDTVKFSLDGDDSEWFQLSISGKSVSITLNDSIPEDVLKSKRKLIFVIVAQKPGLSTRATIIISLVNDAVGSESMFGKILYEGIVQSGEVHHETITISDYDGTDVQLLGENAALFSAIHSEGVVVIQGRGSVTLSSDVTYVALQLQAGEANAVLLLDVEHSDSPDLPSVSFSSSSYVLHTDVTYTGSIGLVLATADNNETVAYSLGIDDIHLLQRLSVSHNGELILWAPVNSGVYNFDVIATTLFSKVSASVPVHLTVEAVTIIDDNNFVLPPLLILNRDEESPHYNLVPFNASAFEGCRFSLSNRWPVDQNWLYVDENGLHTNAIDREHESIAYMALSQIQIELVLQCDSDNMLARTKRSVNSKQTKQLEQLGPYDYGNNKWILTDSINYNPRRSLVNLIVHDINDNAPVFIGKENEPIVIGYPVSDLEERILPRALIEVKATDADVGENAAIVYSSTAEILAVSPTTGSVHVRDITGLENDMTVTILATDRNGHEQGLTSSLEILVKLIDTSHIAVVTIQDAFLNDEQDILSNLSAAVGYEVKALRSTIISDNEVNEVDLRKKREATISFGASMQLYVYGLIEREPVNVQRLAGDINTSVIETLIVASTVSLEDHLETCPLLRRDTALFISTIVLAVLLFILILAVAVWFFLKWRKENYEQFTDENSLASQDVSISPVNIVKPEQPTPRMNIEDLKRSERRLQEMLETPVNVVPTPLATSTLERPKEAKVNILEPPLVFQSFDKLKNSNDTDDEDEFGEIKKNRRKSVVTFNENVEKIIHVENTPDEDPDIEVYRL